MCVAKGMDQDEVIDAIIALHRENLGDDYDDECEETDRETLSDYSLEECVQELESQKQAYS